MKYYPAFLRLTGRPCLVVGGGPVAEQKVRALLRAGASVTVLSPDLTDELSTQAASSRIRHLQRSYVSGDLSGYRVVVAATDDDAIQRQVAAEAATAGVLVNVVDRPELCDFIVPSILERGDLLIAVSTCGQSPTLARRIREELEGRFGPPYAQALVVLGRLREHLAARDIPMAERKRILTTLVDSPMIAHLQSGENGAVDQLLADTVGQGMSLAALGVELH